MFGKMVKTMSRYSVNHKAAQRIRVKKRLILGIFPQKTAERISASLVFHCGATNLRQHRMCAAEGFIK